MKISRFSGTSVASWFAGSLSLLLHPLLVPLYFLLFVFEGDSLFAFIPLGAKLYCYIVTVFTLMIMPLVGLCLFKHFRLIRSYALDEKQERVYPALMVVTFAFLGFWLLRKVPYTDIIQQFYLVLIILLSFFSVITLRWKISMHMIAMGGLCGSLLILGLKYAGNIQGSLMALLVLTGLLASCRLYLDKHTPLQIYAGFLFGLCAVVGILF